MAVDLDRYRIKSRGIEMITSKGLLALAHDPDRDLTLLKMDSEMLHIEAGKLAIFKATVTFEDADGRKLVFVGHGDATPENVGKNVAPHFVRMAETRAVSRALRNALNVEEISEDEVAHDDAPASSMNGSNGNGGNNAGTLTDGQLSKIKNLANFVYADSDHDEKDGYTYLSTFYKKPIESMTMEQANNIITKLEEKAEQSTDEIPT